jgi:hypothetical protein
MSEPTLSMTIDDDLPRTIRREREARDREAREREARERELRERQQYARERPATPPPAPVLDGAVGDIELPAPAVTVTAFDVPFARLAGFFVRAVFAAIPAVLILMAFLWLLGQALQTFFPQLLKMKILIYMP